MNIDIIKNAVENCEIKGLIMRAYADGDCNVTSDGHLGSEINSFFDYLKLKQIPIVVMAQPPLGRTYLSTYEVGKLAKKMGGIPSCDTSVSAMTVKLSFVLLQNLPYKDTKKALETNFRGEHKWR